MPATPLKLDEWIPLHVDETRRATLVEYALTRVKEPPKVMTMEELEAQEPPKWYLDQFIMEESLTFLYSPPKIGKTFLALEWAHVLAFGKEWDGHRALPVRVLYCSAEGNRMLGERTKALRERRGWDNPPERLRFMAGSRRLYSRDQSEWSEAALELVLAVEQFRPHVVILDTLARHTPGSDVASNHDMSRVVSLLDQMREIFGCSIVIVHHSTKARDSYLGAQAIFGAADMMIELVPSENSSQAAEGLFSLEAQPKDLDWMRKPYYYKIVPVDPDPGHATVERTSVTVGNDKRKTGTVQFESDLQQGLVPEGLTIPELAAMYGIGERTIKSVRKKHRGEQPEEL